MDGRFFVNKGGWLGGGWRWVVVDLSMLKDAPMNRVVLGGCIFSKRMGSGMAGVEEWPLLQGW